MTGLKSGSDGTSDILPHPETVPPPGVSLQIPSSAISPLASERLDALVLELASGAISGARDSIDSLIEDLRNSGHDMRLLYRDLIEPAARQLGDWWMEDKVTSFEVTVALTHLQRSVRQLGARIPANFQDAEQVRDVLIVSHSAEASILGATLAGDVFRKAGWLVQVEFPQTDSEATVAVRAARYHVLVLLLGDVYCHADKLDAVAASISAMRKLSRNRNIVVLVGGRVVLGQPDAIAATVGAEAAFTTAADAFEKACDLLGIRRQRVAWRLLNHRSSQEAEAGKAWTGWRSFDLGVALQSTPRE